MDKFETIQGKLFYTVYCMHKQNEITQYQRGKIKDMIVQWDPQIQELTKDPTRLKQNLLEMACSYSSQRKSLNSILRQWRLQTNQNNSQKFQSIEYKNWLKQLQTSKQILQFIIITSGLKKTIIIPNIYLINKYQIDNKNMQINPPQYDNKPIIFLSKYIHISHQ